QIITILEEKAPYADAILLSKKELSIWKDKDSIDISRDADKGIKIRAFDGEQFWEYGTSSFDKDSLLKQAKIMASKIRRKSKVKLSIDKTKLDKDFSSRPKMPAEKVLLIKKVKFIERLHQQIEKADKRIINARTLYEEAKEFKIFVNRYKQLSQNISECHAVAVIYVQTDKGDMRYHYKSFFKPGFEVTRLSKKTIKEMADFALKIRAAKKITPGKYTCLLAPDVAGLLAHESFGHGMESDTIFKDRAKAKEWLGKKIASKEVSIVDDPSYPERNGSFFFDDEGMISKPTYLIKKGIVGNPITEMYSASRLKTKRSANARFQSFDHKAYARMSNTYFMPGEHDPNSMMKSIKDGMYLYYSSGGMEDPKGWGVQIQGIVAERIKDGKLTGQFFYEIGMTGYLPKILSNITMVGNKLIVPGTGSCGKGHKEFVRVSEGGAHLLIKDLDLS
ncbi:MAG: TldD/PmbA family protein, partial [Nanoarchaeota archaeon]|nr:TldD/PmbA family protein [Nanoarchaeota archaeon]